jgi:hypothetical protein
MLCWPNNAFDAKLIAIQEISTMTGRFKNVGKETASACPTKESPWFVEVA